MKTKEKQQRPKTTQNESQQNTVHNNNIHTYTTSSSTTETNRNMLTLLLLIAVLSCALLSGIVIVSIFFLQALDKLNNYRRNGGCKLQETLFNRKLQQPLFYPPSEEVQTILNHLEEHQVVIINGNSIGGTWTKSVSVHRANMLLGSFLLLEFFFFTTRYFTNTN